MNKMLFDVSRGAAGNIEISDGARSHRGMVIEIILTQIGTTSCYNTDCIQLLPLRRYGTR